jgi:hypothetical protein
VSTNPELGSQAASSEETLRPKTRVKLIAPSRELTLGTNTGTIVRQDRYTGSYIVRLDDPAIYRPVPGQSEEVVEIVEDMDNLEVLR